MLSSICFFIIWYHFLCDFVFQTDSMAKNKSSSNIWLSKHIVTYTCLLFGFMLPLGYTLKSVLIYSSLNGVAHFVTDYISSRMTKKLWAQQRVHDFFVVIGADQAIHMSTLFATLFLLKRVSI